MKLQELISECRSRLDDKAAPFLWSRDELVRWINEAVDEAAVRARLIYDETSALTRIGVVANRATYPLDNKIFMVDRVILGSTGNELCRTSQPDMDDSVSRWRTIVGTPQWFIDEQSYLRLYPMSPVADTVQLAVWRTSLCPLKADDDEPEIAPRHHMNLIEWVRFRAYSKQDADTQDDQKAAEGLSLFTQAFGERPDANVQRKHRIKRVTVSRAQW